MWKISRRSSYTKRGREEENKEGVPIQGHHITSREAPPLLSQTKGRRRDIDGQPYKIWLVWNGEKENRRAIHKVKKEYRKKKVCKGKKKGTPAKLEYLT